MSRGEKGGAVPLYSGVQQASHARQLLALQELQGRAAASSEPAPYPSLPPSGESSLISRLLLSPRKNAYPQGVRRIRKAAKPPTAAQPLVFRGGPFEMISTVSGAETVFRRPANRQRPAAPCLPETPSWRRRRWRCGSSCRRNPAAPRPPRCRRRR